MYTVEQFMAKLSDPNFTKARAILKQFNTDFTRNSCNDSVIQRVLNDVDKTEIVKFIKMSNTSGNDIDYLMAEAKKSTIDKDRLERFFRHFESPSRYRLYILAGKTGVGKTTMMTTRLPNVPVLACNPATDPYSLMFSLENDGNGNMIPIPTPFHDAMINGGLFGLDEINGLPFDTLLFLQGLTDEKETVMVGSQIVRIHPRFKIMATMNPPSITDERKPLGDALLGRAVTFMVELTDEIICQRLKVSPKWLDNVRRIYNHVSNASMNDVRPLDYRDYQKFCDIGLDFEELLKSKFCINDAENIDSFNRVKETQEYKDLLKNVLSEMI